MSESDSTWKHCVKKNFDEAFSPLGQKAVANYYSMVMMKKQQSPFEPSLLDDMAAHEREYIKRLVCEQGIRPTKGGADWWKAVERLYNQWLNGKLVIPADNDHHAVAPPYGLFTDNSTRNFYNNSTHNDGFSFGGEKNSVNVTIGSNSTNDDATDDPKNVTKDAPKDATKPLASSDDTLALTDSSLSFGSRRGGLVDSRVHRFATRDYRRVRFAVANGDEASRKKNHQSISYLDFYSKIQSQVATAKDAVKKGTMTGDQYDQLVWSLEVSRFGLALKYLGRIFARFSDFLPERCHLLSCFQGVNPCAKSKPKDKKGKKNNDPKKTVSDIEVRLDYVMKRIGHPNPCDRDASFLAAAMPLLDGFPGTFASMTFNECWGLGMALSEFNTKYSHAERPVLIETLFKMDHKKDWWREACRLEIELHHVRSENGQLEQALKGQVDELNKIVSERDATIAELRRQLVQQGRNDNQSHALVGSYDPCDPDSTSLEDLSSVDSMDECEEW